VGYQRIVSQKIFGISCESIKACVFYKYSKDGGTRNHPRGFFCLQIANRRSLRVVSYPTVLAVKIKYRKLNNLKKKNIYIYLYRNIKLIT
jgi:hypothetical protein